MEVAAGSSAGASGTAGSIGGAEVDGGGEESGSGTGSTVVSSAAGRAAANPVSGRGAVRWAMAATASVETVTGSRAPARSPVKCGSPLLGTASLAHEEVRKKSATHTPMSTARRWGRRGHVGMVALEPNSFVLRRRVNLECALGCRTGAGQWSAGRLVATAPRAKNPPDWRVVSGLGVAYAALIEGGSSRAVSAVRLRIQGRCFCDETTRPACSKPSSPGGGPRPYVRR